MPRYFFHLRTSTGEITRDDVGAEFPSDQAAVMEALRVRREAAIDNSDARMSEAIEVHDGDGWLVVTVPVRRR